MAGCVRVAGLDMRSSGAVDVSIEIGRGIGGVCGVRRGVAPWRESVV